MTDPRTIEEMHKDRESGSGCPEDHNGKHYYAFLYDIESGRSCIDCGDKEITKSKERKKRTQDTGGLDE